MGDILVKINAHITLVMVAKKNFLQCLVPGSDSIGIKIVIPFVAGSIGSPIPTCSTIANIFLILECSIEIFAPFSLDAFNVFWVCGRGHVWLLLHLGILCDGLAMFVVSLLRIHRMFLGF